MISSEGRKDGQTVRTLKLCWTQTGRVAGFFIPPLVTFVDVGRQAAHKHLAGEAFNALAVLVGVAVGGAQDPRDTLVAVAVVEEIVIDREEGGAAWQRRWEEHSGFSPTNCCRRKSILKGQ